MAAGRGRAGYRGYIASRPIAGSRTPQHVQNLVIREYAARRGLAFKLSATEFAMPGCYMVLESVLNEIETLEGVILYSLFMLPEAAAGRRAIYARVLDGGGALHAAVEDYRIEAPGEVERLEDVWRIARTLPNCPASV